MITNRQVKDVFLQMASMFLAIVGSGFLIATLIPFLNPGKWQIAQRAAGGNQGQEWTWMQYLAYCLLGFSISGFTLACAWRLNKKHTNQAKKTHLTALFWLVVSALVGVFLLF